MRITNKSTGQRPLGVYRGPNIINPAEEKQKAEALVGNTDVRHFIVFLVICLFHKVCLLDQKNTNRK